MCRRNSSSRRSPPTPRGLKARLIVFKEFPAKYRGVLACFVGAGYTRVPSYPMTRLNIDYPSFDEYMARALSRKTRQDLRVKFRAAAAAPPIELTVVHDIAPDHRRRLSALSPGVRALEAAI